MDPFAQVTHKPIKNMPLVVADYTLHKNLGMGAFGKVKMATHKHTKCRVAVKVMNHVRIESQKMSEKVKREISILEKCSHRHIMRMFEVVNTPTDLFVVCEFVSGGSRLYCSRLPPPLLQGNH